MSLGGMVCGGMGFKRTSTSFLLLSKSVLRVKMILCVCVCGHVGAQSAVRWLRQ